MVEPLVAEDPSYELGEALVESLLRKQPVRLWGVVDEVLIAQLYERAELLFEYAAHAQSNGGGEWLKHVTTQESPSGAAMTKWFVQHAGTDFADKSRFLDSIDWPPLHCFRESAQQVGVQLGAGMRTVIESINLYLGRPLLHGDKPYGDTFTVRNYAGTRRRGPRMNDHMDTLSLLTMLPRCSLKHPRKPGLQYHLGGKWHDATVAGGEVDLYAGGDLSRATRKPIPGLKHRVVGPEKGDLSARISINYTSYSGHLR